MIPLGHDFTGETVLVVGGGPVGARKARRFAREADVVVVAAAFAEADFGDADCLRLSLTPADLRQLVERADPALVVAATDDAALNDAAAEAARDAGALVNRADRSGPPGSEAVVVPATVRSDPVVAAVATGGTSPALSRFLRERIESLPEFERAGDMAELLGELRTELTEGQVSPSDRRAAMRAVLESRGVWTAFHTPGANPRTRAADVISDVTGETT